MNSHLEQNSAGANDYHNSVHERPTATAFIKGEIAGLSKQGLGAEQTQIYY